jgi:hypothetical protein
MYTVSCGKSHDTSRDLGRFETFEQAEAKARQAGAVGAGQLSGHAHVYDVDGREGDDNYGIWIEED